MQILDGIRVLTTIVAIMMICAVIGTSYGISTVIIGIVIVFFGIMSTLTIIIIYVDSDKHSK